MAQVPLPWTIFTPRWRQAFWNATTPMSSVRSTIDRLVEELVLHEVARLGDLLEPAGHLPDPRPQLLGFHRVEVRVEVALLGDPVGVLHRVGHGRGRPLLLHDRHAALLPFGVPCRVVRLTGRYKSPRGPRNPWNRPQPTSTSWSSGPASPASTSSIARARPASPWCCSRPAAGSAGRGSGTATPARGSTRRATPTATCSRRSSSRSGNGRSTSPGSRRSSATSTTWSTGSTSGATSASTHRSRRRYGTRRRPRGW